MPGFTTDTGGILIGAPDVQIRQQQNSDVLFIRKRFLAALECPSIPESARFGSIFSYEHPFESLWDYLLKSEVPTVLFLLGDRTQKSFLHLLQQKGLIMRGKYLQYNQITLLFPDFYTQELYDELLQVMDFNIVRGEDSIVRAILTGNPFIWHIYCQDEKYHLIKVKAFIERLGFYFRNDFIYQEFLMLLIDFNQRDINSFERSAQETYENFFENLQELRYYTQNFRDYLISHCNLMNHLIEFINSQTPIGDHYETDPRI